MKQIVNNIYLLCFLTIVSVNASNVPVCMWGTVPLSTRIPALSFLNQTEFKNKLAPLLKNSFLLVFTDKTLNVEDLAKHDKKVFLYLRQMNITYFPSVENPVEGIKSIFQRLPDIPAVHSEVDSLLTKKRIGLIINFNQKQENNTNTSRIKLLNEHDYFMSITYEKILTKYRNIVAIYTGYSRIQYKTKSSKLPLALSKKVYKTDHVLFGALPKSRIGDFTGSKKLDNFSVSSVLNGSEISVSISNELYKININVTMHDTHWKITTIQANTYNQWVLFNINPITVSLNHTYYCDKVVLQSGPYYIKLNGFLMQPLVGNQAALKRFEHCAGYFTIPILTGLFIVALMLTIFLIGVTFILNVNTMDRFNEPRHKLDVDPKGYE